MGIIKHNYCSDVVFRLCYYYRMLCVLVIYAVLNACS